MLELDQLDLRTDPSACSVVKDETVAVQFAGEDGELTSLEGPNRYKQGDALVTASTGERWVVSRERFQLKYSPADTQRVFGQPGYYRNRPVVVLAKQLDCAFSIARSAGGDILHGAPGDWVMQYAPGDYGIVRAQRFEKVYRRACSETP